MHHGRPIVYGLAELIASLNLDQLDPGRSQLVIEWIAMRFLDDDFRLHAGNVRQLLTVVTPSSSYGFPLWPKPLTVLLPAVAATFEKSLRGAKIDPTIAAAVPRNPRRFQVEFSRMNSPRFYQRALLVSHSGNAI